MAIIRYKKVLIPLKRYLIGDKMTIAMDEESKYIYEHSKELQEEYAGKYVAIIGNNVIAIANTYLEAFKEIEKKVTDRVPLIAYIPREEEELLLI